MSEIDTGILDRVERLAYQAGVLAREAAREPQTKKRKVHHPFVTRMAKMMEDQTLSSGDALYAANCVDNINFSEIRAWLKDELEVTP